MIEPTPFVGNGPHVVLQLPGDPRFARVARTVASACGALGELGMDEIDDVRLLIDGMFHALLHVNAGPVTMRLSASNPLGVELDAPLRPDRVWDSGHVEWLLGLANSPTVRPELTDHGDRAVFRVSIRRRP